MEDTIEKVAKLILANDTQLAIQLIIGQSLDIVQCAKKAKYLIIEPPDGCSVDAIDKWVSEIRNFSMFLCVADMPKFYNLT